MNQKSLPQNRSENRSENRRGRNPTPAQIRRRKSAIQAGWALREKQYRRIDSRHPVADPRLQAHLRFIKFLVALDAQSGSASHGSSSK